MANTCKIATGRRFIWGRSDHSTNECKLDKCGYDWRSRGYSDLHSSWLGVLLRWIDNFRHCLWYNSIERGTELSSLQAELNSLNAFTKVLLLPRAESSTASTYRCPPRFLKFNLRSRFPLSSLRLRSSRQHNAPLAIRYPPDIRPRPLPGLIFSNIRPRSVTNWISTCGLNRFATCSLRSAECHRVKPTAHLVCVISEVTGAQLVTAAQHTLRRVGSL